LTIEEDALFMPSKESSDKIAVINAVYRSKNPARRYLHGRRKNLVAALMRRYVPTVRKALEVGSGVGTYVPLLLKRAKMVTCLDNDPELLDYVKSRFAQDSRVNLILADALNLPFKDNEFDLVLCSEVLEHVDSPMKLLQELARVKKGAGYLILSTPQKFSLPEIAAKIFFSPVLRKVTSIIVGESIHDMGHKSLQTSRSVQYMLREAGLTIVERQYVGAFLPWPIRKPGISRVRYLRRLENKWAASRLRPLLWTQVYVLK
jgi:ubiquinone/menaquinone biosynthesis C-methylase UbiE